MVDALALVVDLVGELAAAPRLVALPAAALLLDQLAHAGDDLVLALFGQLNGLQSGPTPQAERLIAERPRLADYFLRVDAATAGRRAEPDRRAARGVDFGTPARGA